MVNKKEKLKRRKLETTCRNKTRVSNYKKRNTSLTLGKDEMFAVAVPKYPCLYDKSHRPHTEKNELQNVSEGVVNELDFVEDGKKSVCHFQCFY